MTDVDPAVYDQARAALTEAIRSAPCRDFANQHLMDPAGHAACLAAAAVAALVGEGHAVVRVGDVPPWMTDAGWRGHRTPDGRGLMSIHDKNSVHMDGCIPLYRLTDTEGRHDAC